MAREINNPPKSPPIWAIISIEDPIEKSKEKTTRMPITQHRVERTPGNLSSAFQFIMRYAMNPPKIPKMAVEAPAVGVSRLQSTLSINPGLMGGYL